MCPRSGLGQMLRKDALLRTAQAGDIAGVRALLARAKNETARQCYAFWEFEPSPTDSFQLFKGEELEGDVERVKSRRASQANFYYKFNSCLCKCSKGQSFIFLKPSRC